MLERNELTIVKKKYGIIGNSSELNRAVSLACIVAKTDLSVFISGENGSGKESIAKIIHGESQRNQKKIVSLNCGAIPEGTIDSELFGHKKGSFTSASEDRKGYFEEANEGTLFLDEIADLPLNSQVKLLRVLENKEIFRVGSSKPQKVNVRIIAATNIDIQNHIFLNKFREDLFYRLATVTIEVPPLRKRNKDILLLFYKFANVFSEKYQIKPINLDPGAENLLLNYPFPGNIRQLKNIVDQISLLEQEKLIFDSVLSQYLPNIDSKPISLSSGKKNSPFNEDLTFIYKAIFTLKTEIDTIYSLINSSHENNQNKNTIEKKKKQSFESNTLSLSETKSPTSLANLDNLNDVSNLLSLEKTEKNLILKTLQKNNGNKKKNC